MGGYKNLLVYRLAVTLYDLTVLFCDRWIDKKSRTYDQMVQAARSGKQNIAEGSKDFLRIFLHVFLHAGDGKATLPWDFRLILQKKLFYQKMFYLFKSFLITCLIKNKFSKFFFIRKLRKNHFFGITNPRIPSVIEVFSQ